MGKRKGEVFQRERLRWNSMEKEIERGKCQTMELWRKGKGNTERGEMIKDQNF